MGLAERLKKKQCPHKLVEVDGIVFKVSGLSLRDRAECFAKGRNKKSGKADGTRTDAVFLSKCVSDDNGDTMTADEWLDVPACITGPLMSVVIELNGLDADDVEGLSDPKDSADDQNCTSPTDSDD